MKPRTKKALAEIFAGMIPNRMERNRWRGLLRYGPWRVLRLRRRMERDAATPQYYLAVCAIAKNEGPYFEEWIEWHRAHGVEKFYIYDNESNDDTAAVLAPYIASGLVDYTFWPGKQQQLAVYDDCLERHRLDVRWLAFIDLDEFIVPARGGSLTGFLRRMEQYPAVEANWLVYGSGGQRERRPGSVMERFRRHAYPAHPLNSHIKSIVDPRRVACMIGCHEAARLPGAGCAVDSSGGKITAHFNRREPVHGEVRVNHYAVKSYDEFLDKRARGRARTLDMRGLDYFDRFDLNDIEDSD
jgi:hypothetical protein